jgi:hypothetical protein
MSCGPGARATGRSRGAPPKPDPRILDKDNKNLLHVDFTFTDPEVLSQPWHRKHTFRRDRTWEILEYVCSENDRHPVDADGQTKAAF